MPMIWKKPANLKYTDLCIYIDDNVPKVAQTDEHNRLYEVEDKIYNYLWLLVKALAIKKRMFQNFPDYDGYAFYSASRLYFALIRNYQNQGKIVKGKLIRPIKSCLNYTKALLYPMKVEYQREAYNEVISAETVNKSFDAFGYKEKLKDAALDCQNTNSQFLEATQDLFINFGSLIDKILVKSPFKPESSDYKKLKISLMLNCLLNLKTKKKFDNDLPTVSLWKLPKSMSAYLRVLLSELYSELKTEIMACYRSAKVDDAILEKMILTTATRSDYED